MRSAANASTVRIRPASRGDRSEWLRLLRNLYGGDPATDHAPGVDAFLTGDITGDLIPSAVFVAERGEGGLGGVLELSVRNYAEGCVSPTPFIESWYVDEDLRGRKLGRALVDAAEEWSRAAGFHELGSDLTLGNEASLRAHTALGFEEVERKIHMRKTLGPA